jgi:hypothetical protein
MAAPAQSPELDLPLRMSQAEAALFAQLLSTGTFYLEWGSGGSTLAAVRSKIRQIVSVETDRAWIERLKKNEEICRGVTNNRLILRHVDVGSVGQWGMPIGTEKLRNWPRYALDPFITTDLDFDVILVDGRFRTHCLLAVASCASVNAAVFLHDYPFRHQYTMADKYFDTINRVGSAVVLKRRPSINHRSLYIDLVSTLFDP